MKPDIAECLKLTRVMRRLFGTTDPDLLEPEERRVIARAAQDVYAVIAPYLQEEPYVQQRR